MSEIAVAVYASRCQMMKPPVRGRLIFTRNSLPIPLGVTRAQTLMSKTPAEVINQMCSACKGSSSAFLGFEVTNVMRKQLRWQKWTLAAGGQRFQIRLKELKLHLRKQMIVLDFQWYF